MKRNTHRLALGALLAAVSLGCTPDATDTSKRTKAVAQEEQIPTPPVTKPESTKPEATTREVAKVDQPASPGKQSKPTTIVTDALLPPGVQMPDYLRDVPMINREVFFGNPDKAAVRLSPDAKHLSFLAPADGVLNIWVGPVDAPEKARPVTKDKLRGIMGYFWAYTNKHIIYTQDKNGDENTHVYLVNLDSGETTDLTPLEKVKAEVTGVSYKFPNEILVGLNDRDERVHDIYKLELDSGKKTLLQKNEENFTGFVIDEDYKVRFASRSLEEGGSEYLEPDGDKWKLFMKVPMTDELTTGPGGFDKSGNVLYLLDSRDRNTGALFALDLKTGDKKLIAANDKADADGVMSHPTENTIEAVSFTYERETWQVVDPKIQADFDYLKSVDDGELQVASRSLDDKLWIVAFMKSDGPGKYYRYDREAKKATFLFTNRKNLEGLPLVKMHSLLIKARDGLELVCYLSLPAGSDKDGDARPDKPLPMVLDVHGGPWARDEWGYNAQHQLLANRGYAVLSVNFRGSTGFGKEFLNAANKQWYGKMHDDLIDAVEYCVKEKIADAAKVAIFGGSYGGYACLTGLTKTPDFFACGVDIVGPSNIITLLETIPPYWLPGIQMFRDRVGDFTTDEGKAFLLERSPLTHVANIKKPLLIAQGKNDPRVKEAEAQQMVDAMQAKGIPVTYVLYPDEGHGFQRPANRMSFNAVNEAFLAEHLGGRYQAIGDDFEGSTITVPVGADDVPGLAEALKAQ